MAVRVFEVGERVEPIEGPCKGLTGVVVSVERMPYTDIAEGKCVYAVRWEKPNDRAKDVEEFTEGAIIRTLKPPPQEPFRIGEVVYLRSDLKLERPMTVDGCDETGHRDYVSVVWFAKDDELCTYSLQAKMLMRHPDTERRAGKPTTTRMVMDR